MGAPAKREVRCTQCGSPAEDGFARQYCSNRSCMQYMPPLTVIGQGIGSTSGRRHYRAERVGPYKDPGTGHVTLTLLYPDGYATMFTARNDQSVTYRAHGSGGFDHVYTFGYRDWEGSPMWDAIMQALGSVDGHGEACDEYTSDHYQPVAWV